MTRLRISYQDERGGIDFGEVEIDDQGLVRRRGEPPLLAARCTEIHVESDASGKDAWFGELVVEVVE